MYKKAERLAKALSLVMPAFGSFPSLHRRAEEISMALIDASVESPAKARSGMAKELLALSSILGIARESGSLSPMNAEIISREAKNLLQEIAAYEDPRVTLPEMPTLAELAKSVGSVRATQPKPRAMKPARRAASAASESDKGQSKGHSISDKSNSSRSGAILEVLRAKGPSYIKDISTIITDVSEKTVQRELQALVQSGRVTKEGERRWTVYRLPEAA